MHILLDEDLPRRLAELLVGHGVSTVQRKGWSGIKKSGENFIAVNCLRRGPMLERVAP